MSILFPLGEPADPEERDERIMRKALQFAQRALDENEVPVGALVVRKGELLGRGWNQVEQL
ncbi:MAG: hypothetical protein QF745_04110, partial [Planctomycetota bacterium]|nr:hypothetical protein [Planctomycetota bacterium]